MQNPITLKMLPGGVNERYGLITTVILIQPVFHGKNMQTCTVRYATAWVAFAAWPIVIGCIGFVMAARGRGHWTPWAAALWIAVGAINVLCIGTYRTVFTVSGVQQFRFLRRTQSYSYSYVQSVGIGKGRSANAITIAFADGHKMTVYGPEKQLIKARLLLSDRLPHLGRGAG